ncbi:MAG TPA: helix-turn-helix transcriptional regulator [Gemmatimonadales bacterium]|nr:helix-turn-helix transcriptional regulator [Gemmatimonadales bacterium]
MRLPGLSHLQFLVIGVLKTGPHLGREVRAQLRSLGVRKSGPAFYQLMSRLEEAGLIRGDYQQEIVEGQIIRERHYTVTATGVRAWTASRDFYFRAIEQLGDVAGA